MFLWRILTLCCFSGPAACDLDKGSEEYRITVPLFGAVSSPCCVNLAMRGNAEDHQHEFSPEGVSIALKNLCLSVMN